MLKKKKNLISTGLPSKNLQCLDLGRLKLGASSESPTWVHGCKYLGHALLLSQEH